jgi:hypothetical protein
MTKLTVDNLETALMSNLIEQSNKYQSYKLAIEDCQKALEDLTSGMSEEDRKKIEIRANEVALKFVNLVEGTQAQTKELKETHGIQDIVILPQPVVKKGGEHES